MSAAWRRDDGFTLVELLVTTSVALVVLFAALRGAELFTGTTRTASDRAQAQETARATVRQVVHALRQARLPPGQATPIATSTTPSAQDLTVAGWVAGAGDPAPGSTAGWLRVCVTDDGRSLLLGVRADTTWAPAGACRTTTTDNAWRYTTLVAGTLRDAPTFMTPTAGSCSGGLVIGSPGTPCPAPTAATATTVGLRVAVAPSTTAERPASVLTDAVDLRNGASS